LTRSIAREAGGSCLDLAGRTELGSLAALVSGARLLVCNDTGVSHLAAALKVPSVVISTGNNPERWAPVDADRHRVLCRDSGILPQEVVHQAELLLERACNSPGPNLAFPPQRNREESRSAPRPLNVNLEEDRSTPKLVLGPR
jgi:glycosyl transferase family 9 (putative heptosyltransferase)